MNLRYIIIIIININITLIFFPDEKLSKVSQLNSEDRSSLINGAVQGSILGPNLLDIS